MTACNINAMRSKPIQQCEATGIITKEAWKPIQNYNNYEVSNLGRIRTKGFKTKHGHYRKPIILKNRPGQRYGYRVALYNEKGVKYFLVARLVACMFYGFSLTTKLTVNHIDGSRTNNNLGNLELITRKENIQHGYEKGLYNSRKKQTVIYDTKTKRNYIFDDAITASKYIGKCKYYISNMVSHNFKINRRYKLIQYGSKRYA